MEVVSSPSYLCDWYSGRIRSQCRQPRPSAYRHLATTQQPASSCADTSGARILIIEGIPSVILGFIVYFWLADGPETAYYLSEEERHLMVDRKRRQIGHTTSGDEMHKEDVHKAFKDWKIWLFALGQFGVDTMLYGYSTFLPTIIRGLGTWSTAQVQALTVPCYALGAIMVSDTLSLSNLSSSNCRPISESGQPV